VRWKQTHNIMPDTFIFHLNMHFDRASMEIWRIRVTSLCILLPKSNGICASIGDSSVARAPDSWLKGRGFESLMKGGKIFFSRVYFLCWLLFRYPFHPRVTTVARKRSRLFCQKRRWQVTGKHAYTSRMWLCMKWHGTWLYGVHKTCAETTAVSCGTSHATAVSTPLRWIFKNKTKKNRAIKLVTHVEPHASAGSLLKRAENSAI